MGPEEVGQYHSACGAFSGAGYQMINSIRINDFKSFVTAEIDDVRPLNVIVGPSGSGKTAFLEALFLASGGSLELYFRTRRWRGFAEEIEVGNGSEVHQTIGRDLISQCRGADAAYIRFNDPDSGARALRITRKVGGAQKMLINPKDLSVELSAPIQFRWTLGTKTFESSLEFVKDGIRVKGTAPAYRGIFLNPASLYHRENVRRFSWLSKRSAHLPLVEAIRGVFSEVSDISIEMDLGRVALYATVEGLPEKLPLPAISSGLHKYITIASAIIAQPNGAVFVDEIENGFYYKSMAPLLASLISLAQAHGVQLFASTHSHEFLNAVAEVMAPAPERLAVFRIARDGNESSVRVVSGHSALHAIERFEVR